MLRVFIGFLVAPFTCAICLILYLSIPNENAISIEGILEFMRFVGVATFYAYFISFIPAIFMITVVQFIKNIALYEYFIIGTIIGVIYMALVSATVFKIELFSADMQNTVFFGSSMGFIWSLTFSLITFNRTEDKEK